MLTNTTIPSLAVVYIIILLYYSNNADKHFNDDEGEIILIPDMDEEEGMDADQRIVHAPRNVNRRVPTLIELENEVKVAIPTGENGLDISCLTSTLVPASLVVENDNCWTFDNLLRVSSVVCNALLLCITNSYYTLFSICSILNLFYLFIRVYRMCMQN